MRYISTRGALTPQSFSAVTLSPMAENGGLYLPEMWPQVTATEVHRVRSYQDLVYLIAAKLTDLPNGALRKIIQNAYTKAAFGTDDIVPVRALGNGVHLVMASNGPTSSFKDVALRFLACLLEYLLEERGINLIIVVATSGDTGSAVIAAMRGLTRVKAVVLSPRGGSMSGYQRMQMYGVDAPNIFNLAVEGPFDDCQRIAKLLLRDPELQEKGISGANSVLWARILAQIVYYFHACKQMQAKQGERVSFAVSTGNAGNFFAAYAAKQMGAPISRIFVATNANNILHRFFETGIYDVRPQMVSTPSPSMDITTASNFERVDFDFFGRDGEATRARWERLGKEGPGWFDLSGHACFPSLRETFASGFATNDETIESIRCVQGFYGVDVDPHTAVAFKVMHDHPKNGEQIGVVETALAGKFPETIRLALGRDPDLPPDYDEVMARHDHSVPIVADFAAVKKFILERVV